MLDTTGIELEIPATVIVLLLAPETGAGDGEELGACAYDDSMMLTTADGDGGNTAVVRTEGSEVSGRSGVSCDDANGLLVVAGPAPGVEGRLLVEKIEGLAVASDVSEVEKLVISGNVVVISMLVLGVVELELVVISTGSGSRPSCTAPAGG